MINYYYSPFSSNASTTTGKYRNTKLQQEGQSRQPDIVGQTRDKKEVFYGELKGPHPSPTAVSTDLLRLAIFSKDSLDHLYSTLEQGLPLLTFQTVGRDVTFFLGAKINNTVVHLRFCCIIGGPSDLPFLVKVQLELLYTGRSILVLSSQQNKRN